MNNDIFEIKTKFHLTLTSFSTSRDSLLPFFRLLRVLLEIALLVYFVT